jgi:hypothetical protein
MSSDEGGGGDGAELVTLGLKLELPSLLKLVRDECALAPPGTVLQEVAKRRGLLTNATDSPQPSRHNAVVDLLTNEILQEAMRAVAWPDSDRKRLFDPALPREVLVLTALDAQHHFYAHGQQTPQRRGQRRPAVVHANGDAEMCRTASVVVAQRR